MIRHLRALFAAVSSGSLKHVSVKVTRKRDGVYVSVEAFTGHHTFGVASYAPKKATAAAILDVCGMRLGELRVILENQ